MLELINLDNHPWKLVDDLLFLLVDEVNAVEVGSEILLDEGKEDLHIWLRYAYISFQSGKLQSSARFNSVCINLVKRRCENDPSNRFSKASITCLANMINKFRE